jgi:hypothetical protein
MFSNGAVRWGWATRSERRIKRQREDKRTTTTTTLDGLVGPLIFLFERLPTRNRILRI